MKSEFMIRIGCSHLSIKKLVLLLPLFISLAVSCKRDETVELSRSEDFISFRINENDVSGSGVITKAVGGQITYEEVEWPVFEEGQTKASLKYSLAEGDSLGLFGYNYNTKDITSKKPNVLYDTPYSVVGEYLVSAEKVLWKDLTYQYALFYAYWPYGKFTISKKSGVGAPKILNFQNPTDITKQIDLIVGNTPKAVTVSKRPQIEFSMSHTLAALQFRVGFACTVKSITISDVCSVGTASMSAIDTSMWTGLGTLADYSITFGSSGKVISSPGEYLTDDSQYLMVIPQEFKTTSTATISMVYNDGSGDDKTITGSLAGTGWSMGKKITYTLNKAGASSEEEYIYFDLCAGNVILTDTTYSGFIYVNGTKSTVHGAHADANKYYVFQSVDNAGVLAKTEGSKVYSANCGYADSTSYTNRTNCRIPDYGDLSVKLTAGTMSWDEAVINHPEPEKLCDQWRDTSKTKNYSTINRILICGHETNATVFDITIDHIWSRYFPYSYKDSTYSIDPGAPRGGDMSDRYGGITIGESDPNITASDKDDRISFKNSYTEQVTLRLKNHSVLHRLNYCKPIASDAPGFLKITSADGDGISKGSLSLFFPPKANNKFISNLRSGLLGTGNSSKDKRGEGDLGYPRRQIKNFELNGGILNIQMRPFSNSVWGSNAYLMACFGSANSQCDITINGGTITAVSNSTAAAIGGGGGWDDNGGGGNVTINGGNVYAYNYGVRVSEGDAVPSTAIGGGSTNGKNATSNFGAAGNVYISGGNVYAYSAGGTAIGAGSSARHKGGDADVIISGGNVTAISAPGKIGGTAVTQSTAIGGGRAGYVDGNGGDATVTISGGTLQSGSVGGGKCDNTHADYGKIGSANITISGGNTSAQFIMAKGAETAPVFSMTSGTLKNSSTSDSSLPKVQSNGGAVYMESGTCTIEGGTVSNCSASLGGAVYMNGGTFTMSGGTIKNCKASTDGGGVYIEGGDVNLSGTGTIDHNIASEGDGGGVCIRGGNFNMTGGNVTGNSADSNPETYKEGNGGGIYVSSKTSNVSVSITGGNVQYNASDRNGGGLCVDMSDANPGVTANIVIGTVGGVASTPDISANSAALSGGGMAVEGEGSRITINSGTVKGNVSAYVKNEDIRNDGGIVDLVGKGSEVNVNYKTIRFYANNGSDPEPSDDQRVITSTNSVLKPTATALAFKKDFYHLDGWNTKRDGTGTPYPLDGGNATMNITEDVALYGQWVRN